MSKTLIIDRTENVIIVTIWRLVCRPIFPSPLSYPGELVNVAEMRHADLAAYLARWFRVRMLLQVYERVALLDKVVAVTMIQK